MSDNPFGFTDEELKAIEEQERVAKASRTSPENQKRVFRLMGARDQYGRLVSDAPKRKQGNPEGQVQSACLDWLGAHKIFHWRQNNLPTPLPNGGYRPVHKRGVPDILACIRSVMVGIEVKSAVGIQSPAQKEFQRDLEAAGGKYFLVRSIDELESAIKPLLKTP